MDEHVRVFKSGVWVSVYMYMRSHIFLVLRDNAQCLPLYHTFSLTLNMRMATGLANVTEARTVAGVTKRLIAVRRKELPSVAKQERSRVYVERVL